MNTIKKLLHHSFLILIFSSAFFPLYPSENTNIENIKSYEAKISLIKTWNALAKKYFEGNYTIKEYELNELKKHINRIIATEKDEKESTLLQRIAFSIEQVKDHGELLEDFQKTLCSTNPYPSEEKLTSHIRLRSIFDTAVLQLLNEKLLDLYSYYKTKPETSNITIQHPELDHSKLESVKTFLVRKKETNKTSNLKPGKNDKTTSTLHQMPLETPGDNSKNTPTETITITPPNNTQNLTINKVGSKCPTDGTAPLSQPSKNLSFLATESIPTKTKGELRKDFTPEGARAAQTSNPEKEEKPDYCLPNELKKWERDFFLSQEPGEEEPLSNFAVFTYNPHKKPKPTEVEQQGNGTTLTSEHFNNDNNNSENKSETSNKKSAFLPSLCYILGLAGSYHLTQNALPILSQRCIDLFLARKITNTLPFNTLMDCFRDQKEVAKTIAYLSVGAIGITAAQHFLKDQPIRKNIQDFKHNFCDIKNLQMGSLGLALGAGAGLITNHYAKNFLP